MILNNVFDHYRQHISRMVKRSTRDDYNKRLAMLSKFCAMHSITSIEDIDFEQTQRLKNLGIIIYLLTKMGLGSKDIEGRPNGLP